MLKKLLRLAFYFLPLILFLAHPKEPRAAVTSVASPRNDFHPPKVTIYQSHGGQLAGLSGKPVSSMPLPFDKPTVGQVKAYVRKEAVEFGVSPFLALWIVEHESSFNPRAKGDGEGSRGLWQISKVYHPEVSDEVAFGVTSSTDWSLRQIRAGKVNEWSAYRNCRVLYSNCPF